LRIVFVARITRTRRAAFATEWRFTDRVAPNIIEGRRFRSNYDHFERKSATAEVTPNHGRNALHTPKEKRLRAIGSEETSPAANQVFPASPFALCSVSPGTLGGCLEGWAHLPPRPTLSTAFTGLHIQASSIPPSSSFPRLGADMVVVVTAHPAFQANRRSTPRVRMVQSFFLSRPLFPAQAHYHFSRSAARQVEFVAFLARLHWPHAETPDAQDIFPRRFLPSFFGCLKFQHFSTGVLSIIPSWPLQPQPGRYAGESVGLLRAKMPTENTVQLLHTWH